MTIHDVKTPEEIEREIESQRGELRRTMGDINERFSADGFFRDMAEGLAESGAEVGQSVARVVRRNPAAVALTGAGLAWLAYGIARQSSQSRPRQLPDYYAASTGSAIPAEDKGEESSPWVGKARDSAKSLQHDASARYERGKAKASSYGRKARASAHELRARISDGTSHMSDEARKRVIAARTKAYEARVRAEYLARKGGDRAQHFYDDQPLVAGALALAVGAAIGGILPRTQREDSTFGEWSDQLFDEAERVYHEERSKVEDVVRETGREAEKQARDVMDGIRKDAETTVDDAREMGRDAADKVRSKAESEAEKKNLGGSVKTS